MTGSSRATEQDGAPDNIGGPSILRSSILLTAVGYVLAVLAAVCVTYVALFTAVLLPELGKLKSLQIVNTIGGFLLIGSVLTFITALPPFLATLLMIRLTGWSSWWFYVAAGAITAWLAFYVLMFGEAALAGGQPIAMPQLATSALMHDVRWTTWIGGAFGGLTYWWWQRQWSGPITTQHL